MSYFKYLVYFFVSIIDSVVNLLCSLVCYYPGIDWSSSFLTRIELGRVYKVIQGRNDKKDGKAQEALKNIKDISDGKNVP